MKKTALWLLMVGALLISALIPWQYSAAQVAGQENFPETGKTVSGEFLTFYRSVPDPLVIYGYPITDAFLDQSTGLIVQYFERARFELHPEAPAELRVQLSPLGQYMYTRGAQLEIPENFPACKVFAETGHQVCYAFLDFFEANGGVIQFGYPISDFEHQDGRIVQYFQNARFEWQPERPSGQRVMVSNLGLSYFYVRGENIAHIGPQLKDGTYQTVLNLRVRAFAQRAVLGKEGTQTLYVIVQDQNLLPVSNAQVTLTVRPPNGVEGRYILPLTNDRGITSLTFPYLAGANGITELRVMATYDQLRADTITSFRVWW